MKDERGGYESTTVRDENGYDIATYAWYPECEARGMIFLLHGINFHSTFEWLSADDDNRRVELKASLIERFLNENLIVIAHDHPGHGRSSGVRVYVDKFDDFVTSFHAVIQHYKATTTTTTTTIALGFSLGATVAIRTAMLHPNLIHHHVLIGPPLSPPSYMKNPTFGPLIRRLGNFVSRNVPKLQILWLPKNPDPVIRDAIDKDELIAHVGIRSRLAIEFLDAYENIEQGLSALQLGNVLIMYGENDITVSVDGIRKFVDRIPVTDKQIVTFPDAAHDVLKEAEAESHGAVINWISAHASPREN